MFKGLEVSVGLPPSLPGVVSQLEQDRPYTIRTIGQNQTCSFTLTLIHKKTPCVQSPSRFDSHLPDQNYLRVGASENCICRR